MTKIRIANLMAILLAMFIFQGCNDQGELGNEIIDAENFNVFSSDTFSFVAKTLDTDSIVSEGLVDYFLIGRTEENVFGSFEAAFYTQLSLLSFDQNFEGATVDSVFLELQYDTFTYGDLESEFDIYVYRLEEQPDPDVQMYSSETLQVGTDPLGSIENFIVENYVETSDSTTGLGVLKIPLDISFGEELLSYDSLDYASNVDFQARFNGVFVTGNSSNKGMTSFNLFGVNSRLVVYFTNEDDENREFDLAVSGSDFRLPVYEKDQSGTVVQPYIGDEDLGKENLFLSGLSGNYIELDVSEAGDQLKDKIINSAEICFPFDSSTFSYDYTQFPEIDVLALRFEEGDELFRIRDEGQFYYDSRLRYNSDSTGMSFCLNITAQLQATSKDKITSDLIQIFPVLRANNPKKIILNGAEAVNRPATLSVIYSEPIN